MIPQKPVVILVRPQLGENIGKTARAMVNFGLTDLRLVAPRDGWPNPDAGPAASGADQVLHDARLFGSIKDAIADLTHVYAATVRARDVNKPVSSPEEAAREFKAAITKGEGCGILFGPERAGLLNEDISYCDHFLTVPVSPKFGSLNLAQAVVIAAYEWFKLSGEVSSLTDGRFREGEHDRPATKEEVAGFLDQLEEQLDRKHYFFPEHKRERMLFNIRHIFEGAHLTDQGVRTLRGVLRQLDRPDHVRSEAE